MVQPSSDLMILALFHLALMSYILMQNIESDLSVVFFAPDTNPPGFLFHIVKVMHQDIHLYVKVHFYSAPKKSIHILMGQCVKGFFLQSYI